MKPKSLRPCAIVLLLTQAIVLGQKTEVSVRKGKVIAETPTTSVAVGAGRKAVLTPDKKLAVTVDDPMVDDVMEIYEWVEQEKLAQKDRIDAAGVLNVRMESEHLFTFAYSAETPNQKSEPSAKCPLGATSLLEEPKFYDLQGNLLPFDLEKINARNGYYTLHFTEPADPGQNFRYICVSKLRDKISVQKEGVLWHLRLNMGGANRLAYCRFILPESAIFVDSSRTVTMTDSLDGQAAVTCRAYTGPTGDGLFRIAFLWPERDGTTLADLPPQYRGLRNPRQQEVVDAGKVELARILAGETFEDQSAPLAALLTAYSAIRHKDKELFLALVDKQLKELAVEHLDWVFAQFEPALAIYEFLGTPSWPEEPQDGYVHPVNLCRKASLLHEATIEMVFRDGKWYLQGFKQVWQAGDEKPEPKPSGGVTISKGEPELSAATYEGLEAGKFMRRWLFLGPVHVPWDGQSFFPDEETSNKFFDTELLGLERFEPRVRIAEQDYEWTTLYSEYGAIELTQVFDTWFVVAFARAQIDMAEETQGVLGIGSDDCVKVWLNGELVHENLVTRGVIPDCDHVPVTFKKGNNQLVLKILNYGGPWGFACRLLERKPAGQESD
ncbi:MAG: hypothetical protein ACYTEL_15900 [Planctomycetota bacterium]|jgi:hypothetical protein